MDGATDAIINVTGGENLTLYQVEAAVEHIRQAANTDINTIFGAVINDKLNDEVIVTVIATGFEDATKPLYNPYTKRENMGDDSNIGDLDTPSFLKRRGF
jgi:cell division protein FtsZ